MRPNGSLPDQPRFACHANQRRMMAVCCDGQRGDLLENLKRRVNLPHLLLGRCGFHIPTPRRLWPPPGRQINPLAARLAGPWPTRRSESPVSCRSRQPRTSGDSQKCAETDLFGHETPPQVRDQQHNGPLTSVCIPSGSMMSTAASEEGAPPVPPPAAGSASQSFNDDSKPTSQGNGSVVSPRPPFQAPVSMLDAKRGKLSIEIPMLLFFTT